MESIYVPFKKQISQFKDIARSVDIVFVIIYLIAVKALMISNRIISLSFARRDFLYTILFLS